jgi:uncharacterized protein YbjT (DUF2867 family)
MVLVVGATGLVGSEVCQRLARQGRQVRALVRSTSAAEKVDALRSYGVELCVGDLKDPASLAAACSGADAIISTASSTFSRQEGDSIDSVDGAGQLNLVQAAKDAGVQRFIFVSFRHSPAMPFPLADAKAAVEKAIASLRFTVIQASYFMEAWLSPLIGFDYVNGTARIYGQGTSPISWVSYKDVAEMCVLAVNSPETEHRTIEFGGPRPVSPLEAVNIFQVASGKTFKLEYVPVEALTQQFKEATDSMQKSFAALMLGFAYGDAIQVDPLVEKLNISLTSVAEYARKVLGNDSN